MPNKDFNRELTTTSARLYDRVDMEDNLRDLDITQPQGLIKMLTGRALSLADLIDTIDDYRKEHAELKLDRNRLVKAVATDETQAIVNDIFRRQQAQVARINQEFRDDNKHLPD